MTVLTGAGVSAESGIPTFRQAQTGLWKQFSPEELASPQAFQSNPRLVWDWYSWRRELCSQAQPNPGHLALVEFELRIPVFTLITQNVDGLHQRAGSKRVIELHGNIFRLRCQKEGTCFSEWKESDHIPPLCSNCGAYLRPDVVWFGETLPADALQNAIEAAENCDLFLSIGTSGLVHPAASLPWVALKNGACIVEINPEETPISTIATLSVPVNSGEFLPQLVKLIWGEITH